MKFAHLGDCHLGGWRQPELKELNFKSFQYVIDECIKERVDFILIAGDLFDSAYPPIDILKDAFREFRRVRDAGIPVFIIAGSHDYSAAGKTFLDVLEKAGFCKIVSLFEEKNGKIILQPTIYNNCAIYGYPGKKSNLEVDEIARIKLQESPGLFQILMLHTAIRDAIGNIPIKAVDHKLLPKVDYVALGHLHINYNKENMAYSGPIFPNNISELEELKGGSFYMVTNGIARKRDIRLKEVIIFNIEIKNALDATEQILSALRRENLRDKIIILKLYGVLEVGKSSDIDFIKIEHYSKSEGAFSLLKSTTKLHLSEPEVKFEVLDSTQLEAQIIKKFEETNPNKFNPLIPSLIKSLQIEKIEDEKLSLFEERLISEVKKILQI
jgi:DNA repair exonuclease SbcCD nuclease subunit